MGVNLTKGQKISLTKDNPSLERLLVGMGWDTNGYDGGSSFDLDTEVFLLDSNGKVRNEQDFIFFNNLKHNSGSVEHCGDNRTGAGDGDDEQVKVNVTAIPADVERVAFTATIYEAEKRYQNFGQVENAYIRVVNEDTGEELVRYDLTEDFSVETAVVIGELYRNNGEWKFSATGSGYQGGLEAICQKYGV